MVVEDFTSYATDQDLARNWYKPPHGCPVRQGIDRLAMSAGLPCLKYAFESSSEPGKHYAAICRMNRWDLSGHNAIQFWLKPDGSGRELRLELNIADRKGTNIHDLWSMSHIPDMGDTAPRTVVMPFGRLVQNTTYADSPDVSPVFKPEAVIEIALYIGAPPDGLHGKGVYYIGDIKAV